MSRFTNDKTKDCLRISNIPLSKKVHVDLHEAINELSPVRLSRSILRCERWSNQYKYSLVMYVYLWSYFDEQIVQYVKRKINNMTYKFANKESRLKVNLVETHKKGIIKDVVDIRKPHGVAKLIKRDANNVFTVESIEEVKFPSHWKVWRGQTMASGPYRLEKERIIENEKNIENEKKIENEKTIDDLKSTEHNSSNADHVDNANENKTIANNKQPASNSNNADSKMSKIDEEEDFNELDFDDSEFDNKSDSTSIVVCNEEDIDLIMFNE